MTQIEKAIRMYDEVVLVDVNSLNLIDAMQIKFVDVIKADVASRLMMPRVKEVLVCRLGDSTTSYNRYE